MAKINTLNYQTVSVWDGSTDLFVVEQADGTKVATPEQIKQYVLGEIDEVPTENSENPVKSGGIFSTMAVPKYNSTTETEYFEGGAAFDGNIDSTPTAGSNNAVASGGVKTYVDNAVGSSKSTTNNITISKAGKVRILNFNRAAYSDIKTFFNNLDSSDKPSTIQFSTVMRTSSDHKYMTLAFIYASTGGVWVRHFASYNANTTESEIGDTDRVIGEFVYLVD